MQVSGDTHRESAINKSILTRKQENTALYNAFIMITHQLSSNKTHSAGLTKTIVTFLKRPKRCSFRKPSKLEMSARHGLSPVFVIVGLRYTELFSNEKKCIYSIVKDFKHLTDASSSSCMTAVQRLSPFTSIKQNASKTPQTYTMISWPSASDGSYLNAAITHSWSAFLSLGISKSLG